MNRKWLTMTVALLGVALAQAAGAQGFSAGYGRVKREAEQAKVMLERYYDMKRPIEAGNTVWMSKMTWMEMRDNIASGKTIVIVPVAAVDANGPFLVSNKHEATLGQVCEGVARAMGNVMCAPI